MQSTLASQTERLAMDTAGSPKLLRRRLNEALVTLRKDIKRHFTNPEFDFAGKRLIGADGWCLQWLVRMNPDLPASYDNQQTSRGVVVVRRLVS